MNNSNIQLDEAVPLDIGEKADNTPMLRSREAELSRLIDAMERLIGSEYWKIVEGMHLIPEANKLARRLRTEKNPTEVYRLQGRLEQADKSVLADQAQVYRSELQNIRKQLNVKAD